MSDRPIRRTDSRLFFPFATSHNFLNHLPPSKGTPVSTQTIRKRLNYLRLQAGQSALSVPLITWHNAARLSWYRQYRNWTNKWFRLLFTDEDRFCLFTAVDRCGGFHSNPARPKSPQNKFSKANYRVEAIVGRIYHKSPYIPLIRT